MRTTTRGTGWERRRETRSGARPPSSSSGGISSPGSECGARERRGRRMVLLALVALGSLCAPQMAAAQSATAMATHGAFACALTSTGAVRCWGDNWFGNLGDGTTTQRPTPVAVSGLPGDVRALAAGTYTSWALTGAGTAWCWGLNDYGQLGDGTTTNRTTPGPGCGPASGIVAVAPGSAHACALMDGGAVQCWGANRNGQLGDGTTTESRPGPGPVSGLTGGVRALSAYGGHTCALTNGGAVQCWGYNFYGQLGDGTTIDRPTPVAVSGLPGGIEAVAAGGEHTCALTGGGAVWCWGRNRQGQLGDGTTIDRLTPVAVSELTSGVVRVAAGGSHTCAVTSGGGVWCWGSNYAGQLGDGTTTNRPTPVAVSGLTSGVVGLGGGSAHTCAVKSGGAIWCWGRNYNGELGDGTTTNRPTPGPVIGFEGVPAPRVTAIRPTWGPTPGGTPVTITGTDFADGATVTLGGAAATSVTVVSATTLTAVTPAHAAGVVDVVVRNPDAQTGTLAQTFTYVVPAPDADADGLPDSWEAEFGLDPNSAVGDNGAAGDPDHDGRTNLEEYLAGTHPRGFFTRYFAEGAIIPGFFEVDLALLNVDPLVEGRVLLRYQREGATEVGQAVAVPALGRRTVRVNDNPVMGTPSYTAFSTVIESDVPVVADRTMIWDARGYGAHAETSIASPAQTWYLAEGATHSGFELYYLIQNPNPASVVVRVTYLRPSPLAPVQKYYGVAGSSRKTIYVNAEGPELAATDVSAKIESLDAALPIIVERAMYLTDGWGHQFGAGHESAGVTAPSTDWFLAEGATVSAFGSTGSFFDLYILIANPNAAPATVTMTYLLPDGTTVPKTLVVAANSRQTVYVNGVDAKLADTSVSTVVTATEPVIVERTMWWPGPTWATWYEAHNSPGTTETGTLWALAEGESGGSRGTETYILIANTSAFAGQVKVTLLFEEGTPATAEATFTVLANSRRTIYPPSDFAGAVPAGSHRRYGVLLESLGTTPVQIVVERAMYSNDTAGVTWAAGTNAVGTRLAPSSSRGPSGLR